MGATCSVRAHGRVCSWPQKAFDWHQVGQSISIENILTSGCGWSYECAKVGWSSTVWNLDHNNTNKMEQILQSISRAL